MKRDHAQQKRCDFNGFFHMHFGSLDSLFDFSDICIAISGGESYKRFPLNK